MNVNIKSPPLLTCGERMYTHPVDRRRGPEKPAQGKAGDGEPPGDERRELDVHQAGLHLRPSQLQPRGGVVLPPAQGWSPDPHP